jgi:hypothetical protein
VRLERSVNLLAHRGGQAFGTDHDDRVEVMGSGAVLLALGGSELDRRHCGIIGAP